MPATELTRILRTAAVLAAVAFLHGLVFMALLPHWMGEDEPWHLENAILVAEGHGGLSDYKFKEEERFLAPLSHLQVKRRFAGADFEKIKEVEDRILDSMEDKGYWRRIDWLGRDSSIESFDEVEYGITAAHQPPLYYFVCAPLLRLFPDAEPRFQLLLLRCFSTLLFVGTVVLTYFAATRVFPSGPGAVLAALIVALWPMSARGAAVVNNDVLTRFWVALSFFIACYWVTRKEVDGSSRWHRIWPPLALIGVSGLALFTKTSGASTVVIVGLSILLHPASLRRMKGTLAMLLGLGAVAAAGAGAWLVMHNPGVTLDPATNWYRLTKGASVKSLTNLRDTFVGKFNWESRTMEPNLAPLWGWVFLIVLALSLFALLHKRKWMSTRLLWLAWITVLLQLVLMAVRTVSKGRYLMPVAPALAVICVAGLFVMLPKRWHKPMAGLVVLVLIAFDGLFVWHGLSRQAWLEWRW